MPLLDKHTTTGTSRMIARCGVKGCRTTTAALIESANTTATYGLPTGGGLRTDRFTRYLDVIEGDWRIEREGRELVAADPCGHGRMRVRGVRGRETDKACDARCTNAVGFDCECSCAGRNHGAAHTG